jgi:hypothetical protein
MRAVLRQPLIVLGIVVIGTFAMSAFAWAALQRTADFAPFTMTKVAWNAQLSSAGPGSETFRIEYRDRNNWTVTLLSHSANPSMNGTTWTHEGNGFALFDAWRNTTRSSQGDVTVDRWIEPGMFRALAGQQGWARTVRQDGSVGLRWLDRSGPAQAETAIVYDQATELPISVEVLSGGTLRQKITYQRGP